MTRCCVIWSVSSELHASSGEVYADQPHPDWPREPSSFGKRLRLATPVLRKMGVEVVIGRAPDHGRTRTITLSKIEPSVHPQQATKLDTSDGSDSSDTSDTSRAVTKVA
jgi:hypothetical protein